MKRIQIQIAIDALKKHQENFRKEYKKALKKHQENFRKEYKKACAAKEEAEKDIAFFSNEMDKVQKQIENLEGDTVA